jgi:DNA-binding GntR family transcriptional regulator
VKQVVVAAKASDVASMAGKIGRLGARYLSVSARARTFSKESEEIVPANSKTSILYQQIREKIVYGELKPGAILTEAGLADEYGVSKAPVREALVLLGHEGLVESMPRVGHVVATFTVQDVLETFHLRSILEAAAAGLAAERITEEGIAALLKIVDEESALSERAQEGGFDERAFDERAYGLNIEFHQLIARASGNRRLADLIKQLIEDMQRMLDFDPRLVTLRQHMEIVEALKHGDRAKAEQAMRRHIEQTKSRVLDRF